MSPNTIPPPTMCPAEHTYVRVSQHVRKFMSETQETPGSLVNPGERFSANKGGPFSRRH